VCSSSSDKHYYCDVFDLLVGLIFYTCDPWWACSDLEMAAMAKLMFDYSDPFQLDREAYRAMFLDTSAERPEERLEAYSFCYSSVLNKTCTILTVNVFDDNDYSVSNFYYQLFEGACTDSFNVGDDAWWVSWPRLFE
jgi:hypothetical protein